jgi:hypothetical protein
MPVAGRRADLSNEREKPPARKDLIMRTFNNSNRALALGLAIAALAGGAGGCQHEQPSRPPQIAISEAGDLPPVYTPQQCSDIVSQFPGWDRVTPVPETDAQGRPTLFYAAITITNAVQLQELKMVGIHTDSIPIFMDPATQANYAGKAGVVTKSICGGAEIVWGLVPGPVFNAIAKGSVQYNETLVEAIVFLPLPDGLSDTSITYNGVHPVSYQVLHDANFDYLNDPPPGQPGAQQVAFSLTGALGDLASLGGDVVDGITGAAKDVVKGAVDVYHDVKTGLEEGIGWVDCQVDGCVNLTVQLDLRNTDERFGTTRNGQASSGDNTTAMVRAWGRQAGAHLQLPGVSISAMQSVSPLGFAIPTRSQSTADGTGKATVKVAKGKGTGICVDLVNYAAVVNDYIDTMEVCDFGSSLQTPQGVAVANASFQKDTTLTVSAQNKYLNVLAQLTDGYDYFKQVVGFTPDQAKVLAGSAANLISPILHGRAITPCLDYPNVPLDAINTILDGAGAALAGPLGFLFAGAVQAVYEDDMWLPDSGENLTSRNVPSHEYGHFGMCSLLFHEDPTKMVQIPSLIIQRALEGESATATDEVAYLMEGWADFIGGQTSGGTNYFQLNDQVADGPYCEGIDDDCFDWNYVEDLDSTSYSGSGTVGFIHQVRRISTTLFDAFDGQHATPAPVASGATSANLGGLFGGVLGPIANAVATNAPVAWPSNGDFWTQKSSAIIIPSAVHSGDGKDEVIALPGTGIRALIHNWVQGSSALGWRVSQQQFFAALNATVRATPSNDRPTRNYNWCEACRMFAQHDGLSCTLTGNTSSGGACVGPGGAVQPAMSAPEMVQVCRQSPTIPGFIGAPPAGSDPTSPCTFTGCPAHTILVGDVGDATAACVACGPHQVSTGAHACGADVCATPNVSANACVDCAAGQIVGGTDGNSCVACPPLQIPNADGNACVACGPHQIGVGTACLDCPNDQVAMPDNTCQACPDGQLPYEQTVIGNPSFGTSCLPTEECTCTGGYCRGVNNNGICQDVIG